MKKLLSVMLVACLVVIASCGPNTEENDEKTKLDSIAKINSLMVDSITKKVENDSLTSKVDSLEVDSTVKETLLQKK